MNKLRAAGFKIKETKRHVDVSHCKYLDHMVAYGGESLRQVPGGKKLYPAPNEAGKDLFRVLWVLSEVHTPPFQ